MNAKMIVGGVLILLLVVFIMQNTEVTSIRILFWELSLSRALMVFLFFVSGAAVGWFGSSVHQSRQK